MNKNELAERVKDALLDPWNDLNDYCDLDPVSIDEAEKILVDVRETERLAELDDDERLPDEVTPELVQEVMNCLIRWQKHEHQSDQLNNQGNDPEPVRKYELRFLDVESGTEFTVTVPENAEAMFKVIHNNLNENVLVSVEKVGA